MTNQALIIAHGSPADPAPQETALQALAAEVSAHLPGWQVMGATLAAPGAMEAALHAMSNPLIYPFFMAEGWFTRTTLPKRLAAAGRGALIQLPAFGHDPNLPALLTQAARQGAAQSNLDPARTTLVLAAHGSQVSRASATITESIARELRQTAGFAAILTGYVEEEPFLHHAARVQGPALCLPCFATRAGHVLDDIPQALEQAGFTGPLLPPIGAHPDVPALIARALLHAARNPQ
jgi:sirohydrochlorin ferrochelatase